MNGNATAPTSETIIDYALPNKGCKKYIHLCRVIADSYKKVSGNGGRGTGDHELILVEIKIPKRGGVDRDTQRQPRQIPKTKETKRLQYHDQKLTDPIIREQYMEKLKQTSLAALAIITELSNTTPKNQSRQGVRSCTYCHRHRTSNHNWVFYEKREFADSQKETCATPRNFTRDSKIIC